MDGITLLKLKYNNYITTIDENIIQLMINYENPLEDFNELHR